MCFAFAKQMQAKRLSQGQSVRNRTLVRSATIRQGKQHRAQMRQILNTHRTTRAVWHRPCVPLSTRQTRPCKGAATPAFREQMTRQGAAMAVNTPQESAQFIYGEFDLFGPAVKAAHGPTSSLWARAISLCRCLPRVADGLLGRRVWLLPSARMEGQKPALVIGGRHGNVA